MVSEADLPLCADDQNVIVVKDPYVAYAILAQLMDTTPKPAADIAQSAVISASAPIRKKCISIGANAVIEDGVVIGDDVCIGAGCFIGKKCQIGARTKLWANVSVYHNVEIGELLDSILSRYW